MAKSEEKKEKKEKKVTKKDQKTSKKPKKKKNNGPKESYAKKVKKELKLVKWPTRKEVLKYTLSTVVFCLVLCALFLLLNFGLSIVKGWFA